MGWMDYALLALVGAAAFLAARYVVKRRKTGGCSGDCAHCAEAQHEQRPSKPKK